MKAISYLLVILLLLQSCTVYRTPATIETAVAAQKKTEITTTDKQEYRFKWLENKNDRLIGITRLGSSTAKRLAGMPAKIDGKNLEVDLSNLDIEEIKLRKESSSIILTIATVVLLALAAYIAVFLISFASSDWGFGSDPEPEY